MRDSSHCFVTANDRRDLINNFQIHFSANRRHLPRMPSRAAKPTAIDRVIEAADELHRAARRRSPEEREAYAMTAILLAGLAKSLETGACHAGEVQAMVARVARWK